MRSIGLVVCLVLAACGKDPEFTDGGPPDADKPVDAEVVIACDDRACGEADDCCPAGCHTGNDPDCTAMCGNDVVEEGETCEGAECPTSCAPIGCQLRDLDNPGTCAAACVDGALQSACQSGDDCCPEGCNANDDAECAAVCGNGTIESGETCEGEGCPTACPNQGCQRYDLYFGGTCQARCEETTPITACADGDGCCPEACNANNDGDCNPVCGNGVIERGETCEGDGCVCDAEVYTCFDQTGSAATCDVTCHVADQTCGEENRCCPWVAATDGQTCNGGDDRDCAGRWQFRRFSQGFSWGEQCTTMRVYGMRGGDSVLFTTCTPGGDGRSGDPVIARVRDNLGNVYEVGNDDCTDPGAIPVLAGWDCRTDTGEPRMACASANSGGFLLARDPEVFSLEVEVCGYNNTSGRAPLYIWWNGESNPNPG